MRLLQLELSSVFPFHLLTIPFFQGNEVELCRVIHGPSGTGKTTLLQSICNTRPGYTTQLSRPGLNPARSGLQRMSQPPQIKALWQLEPSEGPFPDALWLAAASVTIEETQQAELLRRKAQSQLEKLALGQGYMFYAFSSRRWFGRQSLLLSDTPRAMLRYDVRQPFSLDDITRADLTRETKQALAYAELSFALTLSQLSPDARLAELRDEMRRAVNEVLDLCGLEYRGLDPFTLEPRFSSAQHSFLFDELPTDARQLIALVALPLRALWAAYPDRKFSDAPGVVCVDDADLYLNERIQQRLLLRLKRCLPGIQWILATSSDVLAGSAETQSLLRLARESDEVHLSSGIEARVH